MEGKTKMKEIFKRTINMAISLSILSCVVGLIMIINPSLSIKTIGIIVSIYIILHGIVLIVLDIKTTKYFIPFDGMMTGILSIILGILLLGKPNVISTIFAITIGVWIVLSSINTIKMSIVLKEDDVPWVLLLILGIIDLSAGVIVIFNPFEASISMTVFAGVMIMLHSIINIVDLFIIKKDVRKIEKTITKKIKEVY